ncbi:MAG: hypothetical protein SGARI_004653, partial [Bacillariaceae sp.]
DIFLSPGGSPVSTPKPKSLSTSKKSIKGKYSTKKIVGDTTTEEHYEGDGEGVAAIARGAESSALKRKLAVKLVDFHSEIYKNSSQTVFQIANDRGVSLKVAQDEVTETNESVFNAHYRAVEKVAKEFNAPELAKTVKEQSEADLAMMADMMDDNINVAMGNDTQATYSPSSPNAPPAPVKAKSQRSGRRLFSSPSPAKGKQSKSSSGGDTPNSPPTPKVKIVGKAEDGNAQLSYITPYTAERKRVTNLKSVGHAWCESCKPTPEFVSSLFFDNLSTGCPCPSGMAFTLGTHRGDWWNFNCGCNDKNVVRLQLIDEIDTGDGKVSKVDGLFLFDIGMKRGDLYRRHNSPENADGKPDYPMTLEHKHHFMN